MCWMEEGIAAVTLGQWGFTDSLVIVAAVMAMPGLVLLVEALAAVWPIRVEHNEGEPLWAATTAVLVPAHNEAQGIAETIAALQQQIKLGDRLLVVADNCDDDTARRAREAGAEVIERHDPERRGKGYALAAGVEHLAGDPPDVVVVVDADCRLDSGGVQTLTRWAMIHDRPVQARNIVHVPARPAPRDLVSALAFAVRNVLRPRGLARLGQPCQLMGTGMALPWSVIRRLQLASGHLVEDVQMGFQAAEMGCAPMWCHAATVTSELPEHESAARSQRTRWEHGHLQTIFSTAPRLIWRGVRQGRLSMIVQGIDQCVPPLALMGLLLAAAATALLVVALLTGAWMPLWIVLATIGSVALSVVLGWFIGGREHLPARSLLAIPGYVLWKLPIYASFVVRPPTSWVRTAREPSSTDGEDTVPRSQP